MSTEVDSDVECFYAIGQVSIFPLHKPPQRVWIILITPLTSTPLCSSPISWMPTATVRGFDLAKSRVYTLYPDLY
ncbi:unnamed protein product [Cuscuta campestris]|uniref:Uncharacterized protein n=1 Tax=Cuscuta campestris TaxID=132261 RepID=A0A484NEN7_9ASTE|nr:unnamed protein product [Cuscuta campestris]